MDRIILPVCFAEGYLLTRKECVKHEQEKERKTNDQAGFECLVVRRTDVDACGRGGCYD